MKTHGRPPGDPGKNPVEPKVSTGFRRVSQKKPPTLSVVPPISAASATLSTKEARTIADAVLATQPQKIMLTPQRATELLERNMLNRPISDQHMQRIARQIIAGRWRYNGDTIKIAVNGDVLDGQHRLWAIIEANIAVETVIVYGIEREAFATIDTVRRLRSGGDTIALTGQRTYRNQIAAALSWHLRWERGVIETYRMPNNRIENSDIEAGYAAHPGIERAVSSAMKARLVANPAIAGFAYYLMSTKNPHIAETFINVMVDPVATPVTHPFFQLRAYFLESRAKKIKDPIMSIALIFKAANLIAEGREVAQLRWANQGQRPDAFPELNI
jgi:hypothetical protein